MCPPPWRRLGGGAGTPPSVARARAPGVLVASRALARMIAGGVVCERWASPVRPRTPPRGRPRPAARAAATPAVLAPPRLLAPRPCGALRAPAGSSARRPAARRRHRAGPGVVHTGPPAAAVLRGPRPRLRPRAGRAAPAGAASVERAAGAAVLALPGGGNPTGTRPAAPLPAAPGAAPTAHGSVPPAGASRTAWLPGARTVGAPTAPHT